MLHHDTLLAVRDRIDDEIRARELDRSVYAIGLQEAKMVVSKMIEANAHAVMQAGMRNTERAFAFEKMVGDLDRNEHGRHEGDVDNMDPTRRSQGNPHLPVGTILGYDISGRPYVVPPRSRRASPEAWVMDA